jgi:hypothetical protein
MKQFGSVDRQTGERGHIDKVAVAWAVVCVLAAAGDVALWRHQPGQPIDATSATDACSFPDGPRVKPHRRDGAGNSTGRRCTVIQAQGTPQE